MRSLLVIGLAAFAVQAAAQSCAPCILYGEDHAILLKAPAGWIGDDRSGRNQGLHVVFYPVGSSWKDSHVVAYVRVRPKDHRIQSVQDLVEDTLNDFRTSGSPRIRATKAPPLHTKRGREAQVYHFTGDAWGNYEAVAYFEEPKTINFIVLNARTKEAFERSLPSLQGLVHEYFLMTDNVVIERDPK